MTIAREEGLVALYKGFVPKVLRLAPGGGVLLLVVEFTLGVFRQGKYFFIHELGEVSLLIVVSSTGSSIYIA